jgi:Protein of unknown function (DUF1553)/Protein of unknown function (DUF1549)/Planctomycete cytochrome C
MHPFRSRIVTTLLVSIVTPLLARAADPGVQFFEQKIRPILVSQCYECHSAQAKKPKGGLLLDTKEGLLSGGDTGPALVPGKPVESLLIKAIRHDGLEMPPKGKLSDEVVADFERWVKMGAPDPRTKADAADRKAEIDIAKGRQFWSFRPVQRFAVPAVKEMTWPRSDIDRFILAKLEEKGIRPVADADRRTLIRRATIDLTGLPPTPEEISAFLNDPAPDAAAFAKVVDQLLQSPAFGERWGRHWLDVARYADSNGRDENLTFHEAYRYRDYVSDSFNRDKPFDRFVMEQVAGDLLPSESQAARDEQLTASGFLVIGPKVLADRDQEKRRMDVVDEQIDTVGRAFLGMTLGCARCHDHKFDPIPQSDYYALAGIFLSTRTLDGIKLGNAVVSGWMERPLGGAEAEKKLVDQKEHQKKLTAVADQIKKFKADLKAAEDKAAMRVPSRLAGITVDDKDAKLVGAWKPSTFTKPYVGDGYLHDDKAGKGEKSATFTPKLPKAGDYEVLVSYTPGTSRARKVPIAVHCAEGEKAVTLDQQPAPKVDNLFQPIGRFHFEAGEQGSVTISNKGTEGHVIVDAVRFVPVGTLDEKEMAMGVPEEVRKQIADVQARVKQLEADEATLKKSAPPLPPLVMAPRDEAKIVNGRINVRGNPHQLGPEVPRGFLQVATDTVPASVPADHSGRLELAKWLADSANPLTARVYVNRVWAHLFGAGLVRTVDNFGAQGERPTHAELLDWLAVTFVEDGWSTKQLIRRIMLSRVYQLARLNDRQALQADPENKLFWRASRKRVEAEVIRDTILTVSGKLGRARGGSAVTSLGERAVDNDSKGGVSTDANVRRSVYLPVLRNELPQVFEVFDFADPDVSTGKRDETTVPTQALFLMNSPFVMEQSRETAKRLLKLPTDEARVKDLYLRALGREPATDEIDTAVRFVRSFLEKAEPKGKADPSIDAWAGVCRAVFGCTEFRFVE